MFLTRPFAAIAALAISILTVGCDDSASVNRLEPANPDLTLEESGMVDFLADYELSSEELLDQECGLRSDAAHNIDRFRRGPDERYGTDDDQVIDSEETLDSIRQVGPSTIDQIYECAEALGYVVDELDELTNDCDGSAAC